MRMSKAKQTNEENTVTEKHEYNPVNMAGKKIGKKDDEAPESKPTTDDYNHVNMAGKKAELGK